uniref:ZrgA family zinc uptake protein n=1 Tax=Vibrio sonorensis TaxID=1004316 RepID=UPI000B323E21
MYIKTPVAVAVALFVSSAAIAEEDYRQHGAHVHGHVEFNIAQDGNELLVEITAPGADVVGFEHAPENKKQKETLDKAVKTLNNPGAILTLSSAAKCQVEHVSVTHTLEGKDHDHDHDKHDH